MRQSSIFKQVEMFMDRLFIVFREFMDKSAMKKTNSNFVLLGIASLMLFSSVGTMIKGTMSNGTQSKERRVKE